MPARRTENTCATGGCRIARCRRAMDPSAARGAIRLRLRAAP